MNTILKATGFTLPELLIAIGVFTVLAVLTVPAFRTALMNNRVMAETDQLVNSLSYARTVALNGNTRTRVCPASAVGSATCGTNWQTGWIVITQPSVGTPVLLQANFLGPNDPTLSAVGIGSPAATSVTFDAVGLATTQANFKICDSRGGTFAQSAAVLPTGFIQSSSSMGIAAWNSSALTCP